jgi:hypothetical protein
MARQEENELLPETAQAIERILLRAADGSVEDSVSTLFAVGHVVQGQQHLRPAITQSPCRELIKSMLQAASKNERIYRNSFSLSQMFQAQYTLQISCEQIWQNMPRNCIEEWDQWAACSVVHEYGKFYDGMAVPPASDDLMALQLKIVAFHAPQWDGEGVGNAAWSLSKQGLLLGDAAVHLQEAAANTAATMEPQEVANTLWAFANMGSRLGKAQHPMMRAIVRVSDCMSAKDVASTLWALTSLCYKPGTAHACLLRRVPKVASNFNAVCLSQMRYSLDWLQEDGYDGACMEDALQFVAGRV